MSHQHVTSFSKCLYSCSVNSLLPSSDPRLGRVHHLQTSAALSEWRCGFGHHPFWQQPAGMPGYPHQLQALCLPVAVEVAAALRILG